MRLSSPLRQSWCQALRLLRLWLRLGGARLRRGGGRARLGGLRRLHRLDDGPHLLGLVLLRLLELVLGEEAVLVVVDLEELPDRCTRQLDAVELAVLVGVDLGELAQYELLADVVGQ